MGFVVCLHSQHSYVESRVYILYTASSTHCIARVYFHNASFMYSFKARLQAGRKISYYS
jgi:hypothetical protein